MDDDDPVANFAIFIEQIRAQLEANAARERVERQPERRVRERRSLGFTSRREDDAELNRQRRALVLASLRQLPEETLWDWIDGLWLGCATEAQLAALVDAVGEQARAIRTATATEPGKVVGRPPAERLLPDVHPLLNGATRHRYRELCHALTAFSAQRRQHHARMNRTRSGAFRSRDYRDACLASPIGQDVDHAGLFAEFFDDTQLIPSEMAARLLHRTTEQSWSALENRARAELAKDRSEGGERWAIEAMKYATLRQQLPAWRTLYDRLRRATRKTSKRQSPKRRPR